MISCLKNKENSIIKYKTLLSTTILKNSRFSTNAFSPVDKVKYRLIVSSPKMAYFLWQADNEDPVREIREVRSNHL